MNDLSYQQETAITLDLKKNRIRIYKAALNSLGNPSFIQLLIEPHRKLIAIRAVDQVFNGDQSHKVTLNKLAPDNSYELYSRSLIMNIGNVLGGLDKSYAYRITGSLLPNQKILVFPLKSITRIENQV